MNGTGNNKLALTQYTQYTECYTPLYPATFHIALFVTEITQYKFRTKSHYKGKNGPIHRCLLNGTANTEPART